MCKTPENPRKSTDQIAEIVKEKNKIDKNWPVKYNPKCYRICYWKLLFLFQLPFINLCISDYVSLNSR